MLNEFCTRCIDYCSTAPDLDLIKYYNKPSMVSEIELDTEENDTLLFAPAGNYPLSPTVTICGMATSYAALKEIIKKSKSGVSLEQSCIESVYYGKMATNLALVLKALGIHTLLDENVNLCIDNREVLLSDVDMADFGKSGFFKRIPKELHLTQSTCCWHEKGKSRFNEAWWDYSRNCRSTGYFYNLVKRFLSSDSSRVFILLGIDEQNMQIVKDVVADLGLSTRVGIFSPKNDSKNAKYKQGKYSKIIFSVHHPAMSGFIYNNCISSDKSLLYDYYSHGSWEFMPNKYGKGVTQECMKERQKYYSFLTDLVNDIKALDPMCT